MIAASSIAEFWCKISGGGCQLFGEHVQGIEGRLAATESSGPAESDQKSVALGRCRDNREQGFGRFSTAIRTGTAGRQVGR